MIDPGVQNTLDLDTHMRYLAYSLEAARAACAPGVDKVCVTVNFENFSLRNAVPKSTVMESIEILCIVYPETLGTCIVWQAPAVANVFFSATKPFMDKKTWQKAIFLSGDSSPDSEIDHVMQDLVGPEWRRLTGLGLPRAQKAYSEHFKKEILSARGFEHSTYWQGRLQCDVERAAALGGPPWQHLKPDTALDPEQWDGAFPGFWQASFGRQRNKSDVESNPRTEFQDGDNASEAWATPPQSETEEQEPTSPPKDTLRITANAVATAATAVRTTATAVGDLPHARVLGRPVLPHAKGNSRTVEGRLRAPTRLDSDCESSAELAASGEVQQLKPWLNVMCCIGYVVLLLNILLAVNAAVAVILSENRSAAGLPGPLAHSRMVLLLDIPLAGIGLGLAMQAGPAPTGCECMPASQRSSCIPWAILLLRMFAMPESMRSMMKAYNGHIGLFGGSFGVVSLEVTDGLLSIAFALMWLRHLPQHKKARYARLDEEQLP